MRTQTEVLKLALDALEGSMNTMSKVPYPPFQRNESLESIAAIKEVLAQHEPGPAAWMTTNEDGDPAMLFLSEVEARLYSGDDEPTALYAEPPNRKPLSCDELKNMAYQTCGPIDENSYQVCSLGELVAFANAVQAAHGIKE